MKNFLGAPVQKPRQIPSLDGLRALSILLVIALHTLERASLSHPVPLLAFVLGNGRLGVQIFFVISGFLITTLLLREWDNRGNISLKSFYIRRGFRILPPLYFYILVVAVLGFMGRVEGINGRSLLMAVTLTQNYIHWPSTWAFEQFWSLCIEEQFYLLWPGVLAWCLLHASGASGRYRAARIAIIILLAEPVLRVIYFLTSKPPRHFSMFHLMADSLMFGALGALLQDEPHFERVYRQMTRWPWLLPVLLLVVSYFDIRFENYFDATIGFSIASLLILAWLLWLVRNPATLQGRLFNLPAVAWVGRLSYSLYLWQTLYLHHDDVLIFGGATVLNTFPGNWVCALATAAFSYYLVEQPSLRLRDRFLARLHWRET